MKSDAQAPFTLPLKFLFCLLHYLAVALLLLFTVHRDSSYERSLAFAAAVLPTAYLLFALLSGVAETGHQSFPGLRVLTRSFANESFVVLRFSAGMFVGGRLFLHAGLPPAFGWLLGGPSFLVLFWLLRPSSSPMTTQFIRGTFLLTSDEAFRRSLPLRQQAKDAIFWGGLELPEDLSEGHFCVVGGTGSGKTLALRLLMQTVLPRIKKGSGMRALVYDAKQDMVSILCGMGVEAPIVLLNPFDARSVAWDIAKDVDSPAAALQVANILIEEERGTNAFFAKAARGLLGNVLKAFTLTAPEQWTLADVVYVLKDQGRVRSLLMSAPQTRDAYTEYFGKNPKTVSDVEFTIKANIEMLEPIAALWAHCPTRISLRDWFTDEYVLVLGRDEEFKAPLDAVNRVIFQRLVQLALKQPDTTQATTWFFVDELRQAGKLDGMGALIVEGRSHGVRVAIGFQDIDGLRDVYGELAANELAGMAANKMFLRMDSASTAEWAARIMGDAEQREYTKSFRTDRGTARSGSESTSEQIAKREAALASELMRFFPPDKLNGLFHGYHIIPAIGVYPGRVHFKPLLRKEDQSVRNFEKRDVSEQYLPEPPAGDEQEVGPSRHLDLDEAPEQKPHAAGEFERITLDDLERDADPQ